MKQEEAKRRIIQEWYKWTSDKMRGKRPSGTDALIFFGELQNRRPDLLNFRYNGDQWQVIHAWLLNAGLVSD